MHVESSEGSKELSPSPRAKRRGVTQGDGEQTPREQRESVMKPDKYVPDYIIYDELKKRRESAHREERPQLEMPRYMPCWPDEYEDSEEETERSEERGETIIRMW